MHNIEPFYEWLILYDPKSDSHSPYYNHESSITNYTNKVYNYLIHPQWDSIGSDTLYLKILYANYKKHTCIIEFIGEWNDAINNDIGILKRELIDQLLAQGLSKFVLIVENVLNFHGDGNDYYEEWKEDVAESGGWIVCLNASEWVFVEMQSISLADYFDFTTLSNWRNYTPDALMKSVRKQLINK